MLIYPFVKDVSKAASEDVKVSKTDIKVGKAPLKAMMKQLDNKEETTIYKTEGLVKSFGLKELEMLLLEPPSSFHSTYNPKISFDHHVTFCNI